MKRVFTFDEADCIIEAKAQNWYFALDHRRKGNTQRMPEGSLQRVKNIMAEEGCKTYLMRSSHKCEKEGCNKKTRYPHCAYHSWNE